MAMEIQVHYKKKATRRIKRIRENKNKNIYDNVIVE